MSLEQLGILVAIVSGVGSFIYILYNLFNDNVKSIKSGASETISKAEIDITQSGEINFLKKSVSELNSRVTKTEEMFKDLEKNIIHIDKMLSTQGVEMKYVKKEIDELKATVNGKLDEILTNLK